MSPPPVALIGFMACGKSAIGPQLAMRLDLEYVDLDDAVVADDGREIAVIFEEEGAGYFRSLESRVLKQVLAGPPCVLATGGGVVEVEANRSLLARTCDVVWLDVRFETVARRIESDGGPRRPLAEKLGLAGLRELHHRRRPLYASCAKLRVDADHGAPGRLARRIALHLERARAGQPG